MTFWNILGLILLAIVVAVLVANRRKLVEKWQAMKVFFEEVAFEMTKVTWPTREEVVSDTVLVVVVAVLVTVMIMVVDFVFRLMFGWLIY